MSPNHKWVVYHFGVVYSLYAGTRTRALEEEEVEEAVCWNVLMALVCVGLLLEILPPE